MSSGARPSRTRGDAAASGRSTSGPAAGRARSHFAPARRRPTALLDAAGRSAQRDRAARARRRGHRPARCRCSTNAGAAARSGSSRRARRTRRSRSSRRPITSQRRWVPSPSARGPTWAAVEAIRSLLDEKRRAGAGRHRHARPGARDKLGALGRRAAACCCASPARGSPPRRDDLRRCGCAAAAGRWAARSPGTARARWRRSTREPVRRPRRCRGGARDPPGAGRARRRPPRKTWAALADGTPLVTAARRGKGLVVLVHITANTTWSNLPLSGLFVEMLADRRPGRHRATAGQAARAARPCCLRAADARRLRHIPRPARDGRPIASPARSPAARPSAGLLRPPDAPSRSTRCRPTPCSSPLDLRARRARRASCAQRRRPAALADRARTVRLRARYLAVLWLAAGWVSIARPSRGLVALAARSRAGARLWPGLALAARPRPARPAPRRARRSARRRSTPRSRPASPMSSPATPMWTREPRPASGARPGPVGPHGARAGRPGRRRPARDELAFYPADLLADRRRPARPARRRSAGSTTS